MTDVFISYARSTRQTALTVARGLRELGYEVWLDDQLPAHRAYADVIEEQLRDATAVVVIWSADAAKSEWVRSEAEMARAARKLVQLTVDRSRLPMPFDQIQCADLSDWQGEPDARAWRQVISSIAELSAGAPRPATAGRATSASAPAGDDLHQAATRRADAELKLRKNIVSYLVVNAGLAVINLMVSPHNLWCQWPLLFWGLGLAMQALSFYRKAHDGREALIARNLRRMRRPDPPAP